VLKGITGKTGIVGIFGDPVSHSLSPAMHNAVYRLYDLDYAYVPFHVTPDQLPAAINGLRAMQILGVNLTIPHKQAVLPHLDEIDPQAKWIGAVNTLVNRDGCLVGYNTDGDGLVLSMQEDLGLQVEGKRVTVIGTGGSAHSVVAALAAHRADQIAILYRTLAHTQAIMSAIAQVYPTPIVAGHLSEPNDATALLHAADVIINTTPVGMAPDIDQSPIGHLGTQWARPDQYLVDIVYAPRETQLMKTLRPHVKAVCNGLGMLAGQGAIAFSHFTGVNAPYVEFRKEVERHAR
jgi:shikimate dehydrogenase